MVTVSVLVHGPDGEVENCPFVDVVVSVTGVSETAGLTMLPVFSWTSIGPAVAPAVNDTGWSANASPVCVQVEKPAHCVVNCAPWMTAFWHHCSGCPHAPRPGSAGLSPFTESRIACARRVRIACVCFVKSLPVRPSVLCGDQAKPMRSVGSCAPASSARSAYACAETKSSIWSNGTDVQPYDDVHAHAAFASGPYASTRNARAAAVRSAPAFASASGCPRNG